MSLDKPMEGYKLFKEKKDHCLRVVFTS